MTELFVTYAKVIPEDELLQNLSDALDKYKLLKTKEYKNGVLMWASITMIKFTTEDKNIGDVLNDMAQKKNILDTFSPDKNE